MLYESAPPPNIKERIKIVKKNINVNLYTFLNLSQINNIINLVIYNTCIYNNEHYKKDGKKKIINKTIHLLDFHNKLAKIKMLKAKAALSLLARRWIDKYYKPDGKWFTKHFSS